MIPNQKKLVMKIVPNDPATIDAITTLIADARGVFDGEYQIWKEEDLIPEQVNAVSGLKGEVIRGAQQDGGRVYIVTESGKYVYLEADRDGYLKSYALNLGKDYVGNSLQFNIDFRQYTEEQEQLIAEYSDIRNRLRKAGIKASDLK